MAKELECQKINDGYFIPFITKTKRYGRAGFTVCPQYSRGKIVKLTIHALQQENVTKFWEWEGVGKKFLIITSYDGLNDPKIWMHGYCTEHKCATMRLYVPHDSNYIWFSVNSDTITIGFVKEKF